MPRDCLRMHFLLGCVVSGPLSKTPLLSGSLILQSIALTQRTCNPVSKGCLFESLLLRQILERSQNTIAWCLPHVFSQEGVAVVLIASQLRTLPLKVDPLGDVLFGVCSFQFGWLLFLWLFCRRLSIFLLFPGLTWPVWWPWRWAAITVLSTEQLVPSGSLSSRSFLRSPSGCCYNLLGTTPLPGLS